MPNAKKQMLPVHRRLVGLVVAFVVSLLYVDTNDNFAGLIFIDDYTTFFRCFFIAITFAIVLASAAVRRAAPASTRASTTPCCCISTVGAIYMAGAAGAADRLHRASSC